MAQQQRTRGTWVFRWARANLPQMFVPSLPEEDEWSAVSAALELHLAWSQQAVHLQEFGPKWCRASLPLGLAISAFYA